jgi:hypothetical protein
MWWERVWTLQEVLLLGITGKAIFVSGCDRCSETKMRFVYRWYRRSAKSIEQINDLEKMWLRFTTMESLENRGFSNGTDFQRFPRWFQTPLWLAVDETFSQLLIQTWNHCASNPRDHIYAKLSLIEYLLGVDDDFIKIDYEEPVARVFEEFTRRCMELLGTVSPLYHVPRSMPRMDGLPSWVPDYSGTLERPDAFSWIQRISSGILAHRPTIRTSGPGQLILKGEIVGTLGPIGPMNPIVAYARSDFSLAEVWDQYVREAAQYLKSLTPPGTVEDLLIVEKLCAPKGNRNCFKHRLFVTLQRHIGRARGDIREGDVAVDFLGGGDSFILRSRGKEYEFVGTAVIYGAKTPSARFKGKTPDELDTFVLI